MKKEDVASKIDYCSHAILCYVLGADRALEVIDGYVRRIWSGCDIDKVVLARKAYTWLGLTMSKTR